jgi:hypothetical protein
MAEKRVWQALKVDLRVGPHSKLDSISVRPERDAMNAAIYMPSENIWIARDAEAEQSQNASGALRDLVKFFNKAVQEGEISIERSLSNPVSHWLRGGFGGETPQKFEDIQLVVVQDLSP